MKAWDPQGKALIHVVHETRLAYPEPVVEAHSEVRKTPVDTGLQRVVTAKLSVMPTCSVRAYRDYFGSHVDYFNILERHHETVIRCESVVETSDAVCCGPEAAPDPRPFEQRLADYLDWSKCVPELPHYAEIEHGCNTQLEPDAFLAALGALGHTLFERFRYDPEATDVHSSPLELFEKEGGVCQDFAHAMLGVLRLARIPARYASGYLYDPSPESEAHLRGASASHAWVQAWHPDLGWVGMDPTNDRLVGWQYVRVAVGRDYADVQPLRGVFLGGLEQQLSVAVNVQRIG